MLPDVPHTPFRLHGLAVDGLGDRTVSAVSVLHGKHCEESECALKVQGNTTALMLVRPVRVHVGQGQKSPLVVLRHIEGNTPLQVRSWDIE